MTFYLGHCLVWDPVARKVHRILNIGLQLTNYLCQGSCLPETPVFLWPSPDPYRFPSLSLEVWTWRQQTVKERGEGSSGDLPVIFVYNQRNKTLTDQSTRGEA